LQRPRARRLSGVLRISMELPPAPALPGSPSAALARGLPPGAAVPPLHFSCVSGSEMTNVRTPVLRPLFVDCHEGSDVSQPHPSPLYRPLARTCCRRQNPDGGFPRPPNQSRIWFPASICAPQKTENHLTGWRVVL
jgi:hypothetical protein